MKPSTWHVYILRCSDDTLYTGITNDLDRRLAAHQAGTASKYTRARLPISLAYSETQPDRSTASKREAEIKKLPRKAKNALLSGTALTAPLKPRSEDKR